MANYSGLTPYRCGGLDNIPQLAARIAAGLKM